MALVLDWPASEGQESAPPVSLRVAGLFAGIGGIELGLHAAGHTSEILCEIDPHASRVLKAHFPARRARRGRPGAPGAAAG